MDREISKQGVIYIRYVIDDGWNFPVEVIDLKDLYAEGVWNEADAAVGKEYNRHEGEWLTEEIAHKYEEAARIWLNKENYQYVGMVLKLGEELQRKYGVTELEAINIVNGYHIKDYVKKYYRIQHQIS